MLPIPRLHATALLAALAAALLAPAPALAQEALDRPLRVFLDCNGFRCDLNYFTEEVVWVDFVRDRQDADVHMLGTRERTGGGGGAYTLEFRGQGTFEGQQITLPATTDPDATEDMVRTELLVAIRQGLAPFAASTPHAPVVEVSAQAQDEGDDLAPEDDPWDRWTFRTSVNGFMNGESQQRFLNSHASVSANRVTEDWKTEIYLSGSFDYSVYEATDDEFSQESYSGSFLTARSLGEHWAAGGVMSWRRSTYNNYQHSAALGPAIEYNVFPYDESNRRLLTLLYAVGPRYNEYGEVTLFNETQETLIEQRLVVSYDVTQPWGNVDASVHVNHYIAKFGDGNTWPEPQYNVDVFGGFDVRLFRGLSFNMGGSFSMVRGQIQLSAASLTQAEILTRQKELATDYRYFMHFGLSYRFGSIFTSVVNRRFDRL